MRPNRWVVIGAVLTATSSALFEMFGIGLLLPLIGLLQGGKPLSDKYLGRVREYLPTFPELSHESFVWLFAGLVIVAILAKNVLYLFYQRLLAVFSRRVSCNLRDSLFTRLQHASLHVFEERAAGDLLNTYSAETIKAQGAVETLMLVVQRCFLALFYLGFVVIVSWQFTLAMLVLLAIVGGVTALFYRRLSSRGNERSVAQREMFAYAGGVFGGIRVVRATGAEAETRARFTALSHRLGDVEKHGSLLSNLMGPAAEVVGVSGAMVLLALANGWLIQGGSLKPEGLFTIGFALIRMLPLLNQIYGLIGQLLFYGGGVRETLRWLDTPQFPGRPFGNRDFPGVRQGIRLEGITFAYANGKVALKDVDLVIPAGRTVALVGASGSGKSTLASLLLRLREPSGGRILVDGVDYREFSPASWHRRLGMVEQEAYLFNDTLRGNLTIGCADATEEQVANALRVAHLGEVIAALPDRLESMVGERGTKLSGGQKQRLAIARAMVRDPQLLVLDEATSALDNVSEREVQAALDEARAGRTSVVIAHRLSTIRHADLIVVMEAGRVVEQGTWEELEAHSGRFSQLLEAARQRPAVPDAATVAE